MLQEKFVLSCSAGFLVLEQKNLKKMKKKAGHPKNLKVQPLHKTTDHMFVGYKKVVHKMVELIVRKMVEQVVRKMAEFAVRLFQNNYYLNKS